MKTKALFGVLVVIVMPIVIAYLFMQRVSRMRTAR